MISANVRIKLGKAMARGSISPEIDSALEGGAMIVEREYIHEAPVNISTLKQRITTKKINDGYLVTTNATQSGRPYPLYIHEGTGKFKNSSADYPSTGRIRSGESKRNKGSGGIRPNRFAMRAKNQSNDRVMKYVLSKLSASM